MSHWIITVHVSEDEDELDLFHKIALMDGKFMLTLSLSDEGD